MSVGGIRRRWYGMIRRGDATTAADLMRSLGTGPEPRASSTTNRFPSLLPLRGDLDVFMTPQEILTFSSSPGFPAGNHTHLESTPENPPGNESYPGAS